MPGLVPTPSRTDGRNRRATQPCAFNSLTFAMKAKYPPPGKPGLEAAGHWWRAQGTARTKTDCRSGPESEAPAGGSPASFDPLSSSEKSHGLAARKGLHSKAFARDHAQPVTLRYSWSEITQRRIRAEMPNRGLVAGALEFFSCWRRYEIAQLLCHCFVAGA